MRRKIGQELRVPGDDASERRHSRSWLPGLCVALLLGTVACRLPGRERTTDAPTLEDWYRSIVLVQVDKGKRHVRCTGSILVPGNDPSTLFVVTNAHCVHANSRIHGPLAERIRIGASPSVLDTDVRWGPWVELRADAGNVVVPAQYVDVAVIGLEPGQLPAGAVEHSIGVKWVDPGVLGIGMPVMVVSWAPAIPGQDGPRMRTVRSGVVASDPGEDVRLPVPGESRDRVPFKRAFLLDVALIGGCSGSPVVTRLPGTRAGHVMVGIFADTRDYAELELTPTKVGERGVIRAVSREVFFSSIAYRSSFVLSGIDSVRRHWKR